MGEQNQERGRTAPASPSEREDEARVEQTRQEWAEENEVDETTPAGAYPLGKAMTGGLVNDDLPDGGQDNITG